MKNLILNLIFVSSLFGCFDDTNEISKTTNIIDEIPIEQTEGIMLKSVQETQNYFLTDSKKLYSIDHVNGLMECQIIDVDGNEMELVDFFKKDSSLYFIVSHKVDELNPDYDPELLPEDEGYQPEFIEVEKELYFKQLSGNVTSLQTKPVKPVLENTHFNGDDFKTFDAEYDGETYIDLKNIFMDSGIERNKIVNGYAHLDEMGLYFHIEVGRDPVLRPRGLYFWPKNRTSIEKIMDGGELW